MLGKYKSCLNCGKEQYVPPYRIDTYKFCSRKCGHQHQSKNDRVNLNCVICNAKFSVISHRKNKAKYCSRKCYYKGMLTKGSVRHECQHCAKEFWDSPSVKRKYCSKACVNKTKKETFEPKFTTVRKAMLSRGLINKCVRCGFDKFPQILGVHHIDRNRNNNKINNLEVLCPNCHSIEHMKHVPQGFTE